MQDSDAYKQKKRELTSILTIYGRKPVLEALQNNELHISRLHLADSNKPGGTLSDILRLADKRKIEMQYHDRQALARISKNGKQDQGVALDLRIEGFADYRDYLATHDHPEGNFIALNNVTNPQNLGMIIRTVCASPARALLLPRKGCAKIDSLVIKASAGTLFKANVLWCDDLKEALQAFKQAGSNIVSLNSRAKQTLWSLQSNTSKVFVLGNETVGIDVEITAVCDSEVTIPMENAVESLNVAVTAGIIAFSFPNQQ